MAGNNAQFSIDDSRSTEENLEVFGRTIADLDAKLGAVLARYLVSLSKGHPPDAPALWDQLYADTLAADVASPSNSEAGSQAE